MRQVIFAGMIAMTALAPVFPAVAQSTAAPDAATPAAAPTAEADRVVCRMNPAPTGSRLGSSRECHTQRQWDQMRQEQQSNVSGMQSRGMESGPSGH